MGLSEESLGNMTLSTFNEFYNYYQQHHDMKMKKITYHQIKKEEEKQDLWNAFD